MNSTKELNVSRDSNGIAHEFGDKISKKHKKMAFRRQAVFSLLVKGFTNTYDIAEALHISQSTASRDKSFLVEKSAEEMKFHIHHTLPFSYKICVAGINEVLRSAWGLLHDKNSKNKVAVLTLIEQCYKDRLEISTNAVVINEALSQLDNFKQQILGSGKQTDGSSLSSPIIAPVR